MIEVARKDVFKGEEVGRFTSGIPYHNSLVARSAGVNATGDFGALGAEALDDSVGLAVCLSPNDSINNRAKSNRRSDAAYLPCYKNTAVAASDVDGNAGVGVFCELGVENSV